MTDDKIFLLIKQDEKYPDYGTWGVVVDKLTELSPSEIELIKLFLMDKEKMNKSQFGLWLNAMLDGSREQLLKKFEGMK